MTASLTIPFFQRTHPQPFLQTLAPPPLKSIFLSSLPSIGCPYVHLLSRVFPSHSCPPFYPATHHSYNLQLRTPTPTPTRRPTPILLRTATPAHLPIPLGLILTPLRAALLLIPRFADLRIGGGDVEVTLLGLLKVCDQ